MREAGPQVRFAIPPSSKVRAAALPSYSAGLSRRPSRRRLLSAYAPLGPRLRGDIRLGRARPALSSPGSLCRAGPTYSSPSTPVCRYDSTRDSGVSYKVTCRAVSTRASTTPLCPSANVPRPENNTCDQDRQAHQVEPLSRRLLTCATFLNAQSSGHDRQPRRTTERQSTHTEA